MNTDKFIFASLATLELNSLTNSLRGPNPKLSVVDIVMSDVKMQYSEFIYEGAGTAKFSDTVMLLINAES